MELSFQRNLGALDRGIRVVISLALFGLVAMKLLTGWVATIANILALFNLLEAAIGY
ncbi:YgaP-like transmembrane domain [Desulfosporosinus sp. SB140]|uniref:YgaP-like transmembrane domain n=1 Tax=Desulfosporosinus paludis TaxID=3115649 RepID=UPI00388F1137